MACAVVPPTIVWCVIAVADSIERWDGICAVTNWKIQLTCDQINSIAATNTTNSIEYCRSRMRNSKTKLQLVGSESKLSGRFSVEINHCSDLSGAFSGLNPAESILKWRGKGTIRRMNNKNLIVVNETRNHVPENPYIRFHLTLSSIPHSDMLSVCICERNIVVWL